MGQNKLALSPLTDGIVFLGGVIMDLGTNGLKIPLRTCLDFKLFGDRGHQLLP